MRLIYIFILTLLFFGCVTKTTFYLRNDTDKILYFQVENMGIKSPILKPDSLNIFDIVINNRTNINTYLKISLDNDTIYLFGNEYRQLTDSLLKNKNNILKVTESWFEKQKNISK